MNTQMVCHDLSSAIVMKKNPKNPDGTDKTVEINSLKLLARSKYWSLNMEMLGMDNCHLEYKRAFLRLLTLILNWNSVGIYILGKLTDLKRKDQKRQLRNLIKACQDTAEEMSFAENALQGLANQCFCQLYAHCERQRTRADLQKYLDKKKTMYFNLSYGMAKAQLTKGSALSMVE